MPEFGIGRVPQDVDPVEELRQMIEAAKRPVAIPPPTKRCYRCRRLIPAAWAMGGNFGTVCPDCYDREDE